jgi:hypothetical protein
MRLSTSLVRNRRRFSFLGNLRAKVLPISVIKGDQSKNPVPPVPQAKMSPLNGKTVAPDLYRNYVTTFLAAEDMWC